MKLKKTLKIQKGGLINLNLNINWKCDIEKCEIYDEKKSIDFYEKIYEQTNLFFEKVNLENIVKIDSIEFNRDLYNDEYEKFVFSSENKKCASCLEYYKQNRDEELLNLHKLLLSINLQFYVDYLYKHFNNIIIFLPLIDIFYNNINSKFSSKFISKNEKNTHKKEKFKELYLKLRNRKNITFKDIDYLLEIFIHILNLRINALTTSVITFITLINTILQLFREILSQKTLSLILSQKYIDKVIFDKLKEIYDFDKYLNIESIKAFLGEEIFEQLSLLIQDYNENFKDKTKPVDIQKYLNLKIEVFMSKISFLNFGILPKLLNINQSNTSMAGGGSNIKPSFRERIASIKSSIAKKLSPSKYKKLRSTNEDTNIFNSKVTWNNFKSFLKKDKDQHTIFDVINNENNDYHILNLILGSISIKFGSDNDVIKLTNYFNELIYKPYYGKMCYNVDNIEYNDYNKNNETKLISSDNSKNSKPIKPFTSKGVNSDFSTKIVKKIDLGFDDICIGLSQELKLSTDSLKTFDDFIGKIFTLDFKYAKYDIIKTKLMKEMLLSFVENIMKNNIDDFIKSQLNEFILQINNPDTNTQFLSNFEYTYLHKQNFIKVFADKLLTKYAKGSYIDKYVGIEKDLKKKDKEIYDEIISFIKNSLNKYDNDDKHKEMFINYFLYYYYQLIELLNDFIKNDGKISDGNKISSRYKYANVNLIPEHKIDKNIFINLFRYTIPMSSELIEEFLNFSIISGYDGFNYFQYDGNKKFIELYITNKDYHTLQMQEQFKKRILKKLMVTNNSTRQSTKKNQQQSHSKTLKLKG